MIEVIKSISFVFTGALIGLLTNIFLERRKKKIQKKETANLFIARISKILNDRRQIEDDLRESIHSGNRELFEHNIIAAQFDRDDIYKALLINLGSFPSDIIGKIVEFFDDLDITKRILKTFNGKDDYNKWIGSYGVMIKGYECQMFLYKEVLKDKRQFNNIKETLKEEYCKRFIPVSKDPTFKDQDKKYLIGLVKDIELIFKHFKISDELNCV